MTTRAGYVYNANTAEGLQRQKNRGVAKPSLALEDMMARSVAAQYKAILSDLAEVLPGEVLVRDVSPSEILAKLRALQGKGGVQVQKLRRRLNALLVKGQDEFFKRFLNTIDPRTRRLLVSMSVDKEEAFKDRLARLRTLYLDDAVKRVEGETDLLKKRFLKRLVDWAEGRTERLEVSKLMDEMAQTSVRRARFFARDQFSKFNKALTIASFQEAEAPYVEVITVGDGRVRPSHRLWNHKLFTVEGLQRDKRYDDYNCRCGFVPRYSKDGKRVVDELAPETKEQAAWLVRSVMAETSKDLDKQLQFSFDFLGETLKVFTINGDFARKPVEKGGLGCQDFTMGMNGYAAREPMYRAEGWCLEDEICLHNLLSPVAFLCTLIHEVFERWAMKWLGMSYDDAHERYGNAGEKKAHMILEAPEWRWQE